MVRSAIAVALAMVVNWVEVCIHLDNSAMFATLTRTYAAEIYTFVLGDLEVLEIKSLPDRELGDCCASSRLRVSRAFVVAWPQSA
jgi:hypothetical protein